MLKQKNQPQNTQNNNRFYRNVMVRIMPVLGIVFLFLATGTAFIVQSEGRDDLNEANRLVLDSVERALNEELDEPIAIAQALASERRIREFETNADQLALQTAIFGEFNTILTGQGVGNSYRSVQFAGRDGIVQAIVSNANGQALMESATDVGNLLSDPLFQSIIVSEYDPSTLLVGPIVLPTTVDPFGDITIYVPVESINNPGTSMGAITLTYSARAFLDTFDSAASNPTTERDGRYFFLVNNLNEIIIEAGIAATSTQRLNADDGLTAFLSGNRGDYTNQFLGNSTMIATREVRGYTGLDTPWRVVIQDNFWVVLRETNVLTGALLVVYAAVAGLVLVGVNILLRPVIRPIGEVSYMAQRLAQGELTNPNLSARIDGASIVPSAEVDEILQSMGGISQHINDLNQQIEDRRKYYLQQIEAVQRIGRTLATINNLDLVLRQSVRLICNELQLYNARIFLIDDVGMNIVLMQSRNRQEQEQLAKILKVEINSQNMLGRITTTLQPLLDNNPDNEGLLLTGVRSEVGLPLLVGENLIGLLTIQSNVVNKFSEEDIPLFALLADKLALALYNARITTQSQQRIRQIDTLNRQLTKQAWEDNTQQSDGKHTYKYDLLGIDTGDLDSNGNGYNQGAITSPITIRGQVVGALTANPEDGQDLNEGDNVILQAVANRVALAIENARLFQETQISLAETSILYQLSRALSEAETLKDIVQSIIDVVMKDSTGGQVWVFDDYHTSHTPEWMEVYADYAIDNRDENNQDLRGVRLHLADHPFLNNLTAEAVGIISNTKDDERLDTGVKLLLRRAESKSAIFIPFNIRGQWRGIITMNFPTPRNFTEREGHVFSTLIDQSGVAIDNRLLLQQTEDALTRNQNLYAASRIINQSQNEQDLVYAAVATSDNRDLMFSLSIFEGQLDTTGWPTRERIIAYSISDGTVQESDQVRTITVTPDSPLRIREPLILHDDTPSNSNVSDDIKFLRENDYRFMSRFPLFSANQPIALFSIMAHKIYDMDDEEIEVYRALTGQMSSQLEIRRQVTRTEQALDETRRLYIASSAISSAQDSEAVYETATEHLARPFLQNIQTMDHTYKIAILIAAGEFVVDTPYLDCVHIWSSDSTDPLSEKGERFSSQEYPYGELAKNEQNDLLVFDDVTQIESADNTLVDYPAMRARLLDEGVGGMLIAPIKARDRWFGVVIVQSTQPYAFNDQYQRFVSAMADQVSIAVDNQQLFIEAQAEAHRAQAEARRSRALVEASQLANRMGENLAASLEDVFVQVAEAASFDRWLLVMLNEDRASLEIANIHLPGKSSPEELTITMQQRLPIIDAVRFGRGQIVNSFSGYLANITNPPKNAEELVYLFGKHITMPVLTSDNLVLGALFMGRDQQTDDLIERDEELVSTLATQVGLALDNRRLLQQAQTERVRLRSILDTMPAGILVLEPDSLIPEMYNDQVEQYLGRSIDPETPFSNEEYNLFRTGTDLHYPREEMPIFSAISNQAQTFTDDVAVIHNGHHTDLMVNAAPIHDNQGNMTAIVAAFQDISNLRSLENTLQENLRETVALYEAQLQLSEAGELDEVLDIITMQLMIFQPDEVYVIFSDEDGALQLERFYVKEMSDVYTLQPILHPQNAINVEDVYESPLDEIARNTLADLGMRSLISIPIRTRQRPMGWMVMLGSQPNQFTSDQEPTLTQLSDIIATAVDNRFLIQSQQTTLQEIGALYSATTTISRTRDIDQLAVVLEAALATLRPTYALGFLFNTSTEDENIKQLFSIKPENVEQINFHEILSNHTLSDDSLYIDNLEEFTENTPLVRDLKQLEGIQSIAIVNLRVKDTIGGHLVLAYDKPYHFTDNEDRYLNTIIDSASVVVDNILLFEQIQSTLEETSVMYQASRALTDAATPDEIVDVVVNYLIHPYVNQVFLALLNGSNWELPSSTVQIAADWNEDEDSGLNLGGLVLTREQFPAWSQLSIEGVTAIDDINKHPNLSEQERIGIESLDIRSLVIIPLRVPKREIGSIWLGSREPHKHDVRELRIYQAFAEQASLSMEAAYLLQQTDRRARQLETSAQVSQTAGQILDLEVLMPRLVNLIRDAFAYDHVQIFLMDDRDDWAQLRASTGEPGRQLLEISHKLRKASASVVGQVTEQGTPQIALDTADANVVHAPNPYLPLTRSEMALPLLIKGRVVGALDVQSNQPNAFTDEDVNVLTTLAAQISVAIENANLYEESLKQADQMSFLFEVSNAAAAAETLEDAVQGVITQLRKTMKAQAVAVYLKRTYLDEQTQAQFTTMEAVALNGSEQPLSEIEEVRTNNQENMIGVVSTEGSPYIIEDIALESRYLPITPSSGSAIILPLISGTELIGLVAIEDKETHAYEFDTVQLLQTLAGSIAAIFQSAALLEQLTRTTKELLELDKVKSDFLANMSHELRTPLNSIIGFSRVMLKGIDGELTEMQEQDLTTIYSSGQHLLTLINDILDQAKIAAGKLEVKPDFFDAKAVVEAVKSIGIGLVKDKPVNITSEIAPNLPQAYGDEIRTRQVLINLISNAAKFTETGGINIRMYTVEDPTTGTRFMRIDVSDSGIGIAEQDLPLLFEAFRQVDSSLTRTAGGTGLGLPIAKSLVEMQGGVMTVESEVNVGSTFSITIPLEVWDHDEEDEDDGSPKYTRINNSSSSTMTDTTEQDQINPPTKPTIEMKAVHAGVTTPIPIMPQKRDVLLIEDNKGMVDQFRRSLQREGFEVVTADHPSYAEAMVSNLRPTVIVMDVNFADGQGWDILTRLKDRDDTFDLPIVVVTLNDESERAYRLGAHTFIQRPFTPEDLMKAVLDAEQESNKDRILIIDDQPDAIRLLEGVLNENGTFRVFSAGNGKDGISLVARRRPDLIILDLRMPDMDGFAVLKELRSNPETANIPVMIVTGEIDFNEDEQKLLKDVHVLQKMDISEEEYDQFISDVQRNLRHKDNK